MKIVWSERSLKDLDFIFEFYVFSASINVAQKITGKLIEKVKILTSYPEIGVVENLDFDVPFEYRYIIEGNYKIIYRIVEQKAILIARVFDTRMDPKKKTV
ncbi:type II toxin-antitoxin system RelE/ParE family toxin [Algoriphagus machipongonensis]|uniref:Toxin-antitoxin system, toxin component, RelE family n=1 Tax=Algoriphagus machipongonensis TaxID=388413 RepID=A3HU69_9BACT|nr:type II toxin-antitoxin system RelE/ParE family toxin [Algoriphagus machipongonensis]EAZ81691.1 toxin-antitoxin system, toxin component, RelE family [Algoriphagus machipongonensis]